jgi:hypothetical protein
MPSVYVIPLEYFCNRDGAIFLRKIKAHVEYPSEGLRRNCSFIKINICTRVNTWYYFGIEFYSGYAEKNLVKRI